MSTPRPLEYFRKIDNSRFGSFQIGLCILCGLCLIMDGFDVEAMGYVARPSCKSGTSELAVWVRCLARDCLDFSRLAAVQHARGKIGRRPVLIVQRCVPRF